MSASLKKIETKMSSLINIDKRNWTEFYLLLKEVEERELYKPQYKSFSAWIKQFCMDTKTHESIIWNRKKAGRVYEDYMHTQKRKGIEVAPIQEINVAVDSLVILDKINKYDTQVASKLVDKVINKEISRKDLKEVYQSVRPSVEKISNNPHFKVVEDAEPLKKSKRKTELLRASDIVSSLISSEWLGVELDNSKQRFISAYERNKYRVFAEFPVYTGTTRHSRRIDVLAVENITTLNVWELNVHGIEIKVFKSDLTKDNKYSEYTEFVDYMWLAIPRGLIKVAKEHTFNECGIIVIESDGTPKIYKQATRLNPLRKNETLTSIALKSM